MKRPLLLVLAAVALCGCGGKSDPSNQTDSPPPGLPDAGRPIVKPTITAFTVTPDTLPAGGGKVTLQWTASDALRLAIDPGVGDVTGKSSVEVNVTASTAFTLTATNLDGTVSATARVTVAQAVTVTGRVIDVHGQPMAAATVVIGSQPATVTDADGRFSVAGVVPPFTATVVGADQQSVTVYEGLSASTLTLTLLATLRDVSTAGLSGAVSGGNPNHDALHAPFVGFASSEVGATGVTVPAMTDTFSFSVSWPTQQSTTGTVFALQPTRDSTGKAVSWDAFGRLDHVTLNPNSDVSALAITMSTVSSSTLNGAVTVPTRYAVDQVSAVLELDPVGALEILNSTSGSTSFGFNVPMVPQSSYAVVAWGHPQNRVNDATSLAIAPGRMPGDNAISVPLAPVPSLAVPADQANAVDVHSSFVWSLASPGSVFDLRAVKTSSGTPLQIDVVTSGSSTTLPDLSAIGVAVPAATQFEWQVIGFAPFNDINEAATTAELGALLDFRRQGSLVASDVRSFTTR